MIDRVIWYWQSEYPKYTVPPELIYQDGPLFSVVNSMIEKGFSIPEIVHETIGLKYGLCMLPEEQLNFFGEIRYPE